MAHSVDTLIWAVVVTLMCHCLLTQASEYQCSGYTDTYGEYHQGLLCSSDDGDDEGLAYCCDDSSGYNVKQWCCTKTEWEQRQPDNGEMSLIVGLCVGVTLLLTAIAIATALIIQRRRRRRTTMHVARVNIGEAPCDQTSKSGQYIQFENPPS